MLVHLIGAGSQTSDGLTSVSPSPSALTVATLLSVTQRSKRAQAPGLTALERCLSGSVHVWTFKSRIIRVNRFLICFPK